MRPTPFALAACLSLAAAARAEDAPQPAGAGILATEVDEEPPPPVVLRQVPPRYSWEMAFQVSYGMLPEFEESTPWAGFGLRGGWGKHYGNHRVGVGASVSFEGPVTVQWSNLLEPMFLYDWVHPKGAYLGVSAGPSFVLGVDTSGTIRNTTELDVGPFLAARIGYSQAYSMVARRFFVAAEPKVRYVDGRVSGLVSIVLGSGRGY